MPMMAPLPTTPSISLLYFLAWRTRPFSCVAYRRAGADGGSDIAWRGGTAHLASHSVWHFSAIPPAYFRNTPYCAHGWQHYPPHALPRLRRAYTARLIPTTLISPLAAYLKTPPGGGRKA